MHTSAGGSCRSPKSTPVDDLSAPGFDSKIMGGCDRPYIGLMPLSSLSGLEGGCFSVCLSSGVLSFGQRPF